MRAELNQRESSSLDAGAPVQLDQSRVGRLSRMAALQAQVISQETDRRRQQQLRAIAIALKAIDEGRYSIGEDCAGTA